ncbi:hypothetical protein [Natrinema halophilum]|uniref:Uncharacterized protein n=1 Tax=Natrinema halophilum TaxID=1699371 RepID=A0A7D5GJ69_9EURY|nr:hypothetical protein [Natrinema halophilum]QLG47592.1 hypothetical protein HYG82_01380 [Natrinema halophilum]
MGRRAVGSSNRNENLIALLVRDGLVFASRFDRGRFDRRTAAADRSSCRLVRRVRRNDLLEQFFGLLGGAPDQIRREQRGDEHRTGDNADDRQARDERQISPDSDDRQQRQQRDTDRTIEVPNPSANATQKPSVRVCSTIYAVRGWVG